MGFFKSILKTASKAFKVITDSTGALDLIAGVAKGFGAYMGYKQQNEQQAFLERQYEDEMRRRADTTAAPSKYDNSLPLSSFSAGNLLAGSMADVTKNNDKGY